MSEMFPTNIFQKLYYNRVLFSMKQQYRYFYLFCQNNSTCTSLLVRLLGFLFSNVILMYQIEIQVTKKLIRLYDYSILWAYLIQKSNFLNRLLLKFKVSEFELEQTDITVSACSIFSLCTPFPTFYVHEDSLLMSAIYHSKLFLATFMNKTQQ